MPIQFTCPKRTFRISSQFDTWKSDTWDTGESTWPEGFDKPRVCSHCGCANPQDVVELVKLGWEIEPSAIAYKWFINPPGQKAHDVKVLAGIGDYSAEQRAFDASFVVPAPMVMLLGAHTSNDQLDELNMLLRKQRKAV